MKDQINQERKVVLAGGLLPQPLADVFVLKCYVNKVPKSVVIRNLIEEYITRNGQTQQQLCEHIGQQIISDWTFKSEPNTSFELFCDNQKKILVTRGIAEKHIRVIFNYVQNIYHKVTKDGTHTQ